jgi:hypothetical protein
VRASISSTMSARSRTSSFVRCEMRPPSAT